MEYNEIREFIRMEALAVRRMDRIITQPEFEDCIAAASKLELEQMRHWVENKLDTKIRKWMRTKLEQDWHNLSITTLKLMAKRYRIKDWHLLNKTNLIEAIELEKRKRLFDRGDRTETQGD